METLAVIINRDNIHSIGEPEGKIEKLKDEYEKTRMALNTLSMNQEHINDVIEQDEIFFSLCEKPTLSGSEQLKLKISSQAIQSNNIRDSSDIEQLKSVQAETDKKIAVLKNNFKNCKHLYEVYYDMAKTYYDISKGDYISRLVDEEQKKREREEQLLLIIGHLLRMVHSISIPLPHLADVVSLYVPYVVKFILMEI